MRMNPSFLACAALLFCSGLFVPGDTWAAAAVQRRVQQQKIQQQQLMQQAYQQAMAQKQAQEVAAYQQAMAQKQALMQQAAYQKAAAEYSAYKQAMQQAVAQRAAEAQAVAQVKQAVARRQQEAAAYQGAVARKQMAEAVAYRQAAYQKAALEQKAQAEVNQQVREYAQYLAARKAALAEQGIMMKQAVAGQQLLQHTAVQQVKNQQARAAVEQKIAAETVAARAALGQKMANDVLASRSAEEASGAVDETDTVVDIQDLWDALDVSSDAWPRIVDKEIKLLTVSEYIDRFRKMKVTIKKAPGYYVGLIDTLGEQMDGFLSAPFSNVLSYAAIIEYDFDNGVNKDELARQVLGEAQFASNRQRVLGR